MDRCFSPLLLFYSLFARLFFLFSSSSTIFCPFFEKNNGCSFFFLRLFFKMLHSFARLLFSQRAFCFPSPLSHLFIAGRLARERGCGFPCLSFCAERTSKTLFLCTDTPVGKVKEKITRSFVGVTKEFVCVRRGLELNLITSPEKQHIFVYICDRNEFWRGELSYQTGFIQMTVLRTTDVVRGQNFPDRISICTSSFLISPPSRHLSSPSPFAQSRRGCMVDSQVTKASN